jgi:hypothetical protein
MSMNHVATDMGTTLNKNLDLDGQGRRQYGVWRIDDAISITDKAHRFWQSRPAGTVMSTKQVVEAIGEKFDTGTLHVVSGWMRRAKDKGMLKPVGNRGTRYMYYELANPDAAIHTRSSPSYEARAKVSVSMAQKWAEREREASQETGTQTLADLFETVDIPKARSRTLSDRLLELASEAEGLVDITTVSTDALLNELRRRTPA